MDVPKWLPFLGELYFDPCNTSNVVLSYGMGLQGKRCADWLIPPRSALYGSWSLTTHDMHVCACPYHACFIYGLFPGKMHHNRWFDPGVRTLGQQGKEKTFPWNFFSSGLFLTDIGFSFFMRDKLAVWIVS